MKTIDPVKITVFGGGRSYEPRHFVGAWIREVAEDEWLNCFQATIPDGADGHRVAVLLADFLEQASRVLSRWISRQYDLQETSSDIAVSPGFLLEDLRRLAVQNGDGQRRLPRGRKD